MDDTSEHRARDRLRAIDPLGGTARGCLGADTIVAAVVASHRARRRRVHRLTLTAVPMLLAAVALPLALAAVRTPTPHATGTAALGLHGAARVVVHQSPVVPTAGAAVNGLDYWTIVPADLVFSTTATFAATPSITSAGRVFALDAPPSALATARRLAASLGMSRRPLSIHGASVTVGTTAGARLTVAPRGGVLHWTYVAPPGSTLSASGTPSSDTLDKSVTQARTILSHLDNGYGDANYAAPSAVTGRTVQVRFSLEVDGEPTDLGTTFVFGPGSLLERASGVVVRLRAGGSYAALSPTAALAVLRSTSYCTVEPPKGSRPFRPEVVRVDIEHASARFTTFEAGRHTSVLVPEWRLEGPATVKGETVSQFAFDVVSLRPDELRIAHPRCTPVG